jgi:hypothetical protein
MFCSSALALRLYNLALLVLQLLLVHPPEPHRTCTACFECNWLVCRLASLIGWSRHPATVLGQTGTLCHTRGQLATRTEIEGEQIMTLW